MKKLLLVLAICLGSFNALASPIAEPINQLFDAMREHNAEKLLNQFTSEALLQRAVADGSVKTSEIGKFAESISQSDRYLDEHLLQIKINQSGNLASVWTPYVFYLDKKLSHCGVNSFQMVKTANGWKIHYLIDNTYEGDCEEFIKQHK